MTMNLCETCKNMREVRTARSRYLPCELSATNDAAEQTLRPASGSGSAETVAGTAVGTPAFISPKQAEGRLDLLGPASDATEPYDPRQFPGCLAEETGRRKTELAQELQTGHRQIGAFFRARSEHELRPYLEECFELAHPGTVFVINRYREANCNMRTQFMRIIRKAGLLPWPKLFHNLRASRETELAATYPLHTVCEWIGNSARIASAHYLQVTEADFERASKCGAESGALVAQNRPQHASAHGTHRTADETEGEEDCEGNPSHAGLREMT